MSLVPDWNVFPGNAVVLISAKLEDIDTDVLVVNRPLRSSDPNLTIGVFPVSWAPIESSLEIGHSSPGEPTLQNYSVAVQGFVKHGDKDMALAISTLLSKRIRDTLYRDTTLRLALQALSVNDGFSQERFTKAKLRNQQYMNNEIKTQFAFLSVLDILIETETV